MELVIFIIALELFIVYSFLTMFYIRHFREDYQPKLIIIGWFVSVLPVLFLALYEIVRYIYG